MLDDIPLHGQSQPPKTETKQVAIFNYKPEDINLRNELAEQYSKAKSLFANIEYDDEVPANQKAQVLNSLVSILAQITKSEAEVHSLNEVKKLEDALITALKQMPEDFQAIFYDAYTKAHNE